MNADERREFEKLQEALYHAVQYLELTSCANAELHMAERVMYPPLTAHLRNRLEGSYRFLAGQDDI